MTQSSVCHSTSHHIWLILYTCACLMKVIGHNGHEVLQYFQHMYSQNMYHMQPPKLQAYFTTEHRTTFSAQQIPMLSGQFAKLSKTAFFSCRLSRDRRKNTTSLQKVTCGFFFSFFFAKIALSAGHCRQKTWVLGSNLLGHIPCPLSMVPSQYIFGNIIVRYSFVTCLYTHLYFIHSSLRLITCRVGLLINFYKACLESTSFY